MAGLTEDELKAYVSNEMRNSLGYNSSKLSNARQKAEYFYLGIPIGELAPPEIDGRSSVVSTDVRDTIEAMLPQLVVTFLSGDSVAEFEATKPGDEDKASQATEYVNYLFLKKNNGHKIGYTWMKDALLQKNGIVKVWWDTRFEEKKEEYRGLSDVELAQLLDDDEIELVAQNTYVDEDDQQQRQQAIQQMAQSLQQAQLAAQQGNPQAPEAIARLQQQIQSVQQTPPKMLYDVTCKRIPGDGKLCVENVPPEEFLIARNAKDIQSARYVGHRVQRTQSELKSMGYKNVDQISGEDQSQAVNSERIQRLSWNDENAYLSDETSMDESQRLIWVTECYVRADYDGDGIAELRKVTIAGNEMLDNEEVDYIPFVSITPVPLPHTFFGLSIADLAFETQKTKTSIRRALLDNLYLSVNGRYFAVENQVNLDDLLTSRPGGVVRIKNPQAVGRLDQGMGDAQGAMAMLEYEQQDLENRTGWSRQSMGNAADGLQPMTATQSNIVTNKADMRLDLVARNFADGYVELFKLILKLVCQYQKKKDVVKLTGGWVEINPAEWRNQFDVNINVGIGMGSKDQKVMHLMSLQQDQAAGLQVGFATPQNVYNLAAEKAKLIGFKNADKFFTDPSKMPPKPPAPNPDQMKAQAQMQIEQAKMQANGALKQMEIEYQMRADAAAREHEAQLEQLKAQMQAQVDNNRQLSEAQQHQLKIEHEAKLEQMKAGFEEMQHQRDKEFEAWKAKLDAETSIMVAQIGAAAKSGAESPEQANAVAAAMQQFAEQMNQQQQGFIEALNQLRKPRTIVRGPDGRAQGII